MPEGDARRIAMRCSDAAMDAFRCGDELWERAPEDWERIADDIAEGFFRVLRAVDFP